MQGFLLKDIGQEKRTSASVFAVPGFAKFGKKMFALRGHYLPFTIRYAIRLLLSCKVRQESSV